MAVSEPTRRPAARPTPRPATPSEGARSAHGTRAEPFRVALVGAGYVAGFHLDLLAEMADCVELVAVCDPDLNRAEAAVRRWRGAGSPRAVAATAELPGLGVELAHVLTPPDLHVPITRELLGLGVGAFVEKPVALSSAAARELQELATERCLPLGVNHNNLHHPAFEKLLAHVRAGRLGRVVHVRTCLAVPLAQLDAGDFAHWMFRSPENVIFEQAPHPLSQVHALVGRLCEARTTLLGTRELLPGQTFHDRWSVAARAERGTAEVYLAFSGSAPRWTLEVLGTDGFAEADLGLNLFSFQEKTPWLDFWNDFLGGWRRGGQLRRGALSGLFHYGRFTLGLGRREDSYFAGMRGSVRAFYDALAEDRKAPVDAAEAAEVLEWCEAIAEESRRCALVGSLGGNRTALRAAPEPPPEPGSARAGEIVVLGGTGFIGRRVIARLVERGAPVTAVVRRTHGLPPEVAEPAQTGRVRLLRGRLEDPRALARAFEGARCVLHLATGGGETWEQVERTMVRGSVAAAEAALDRGVERFVYVSSIAALYAGPDFGAESLEDSLETDPQIEERDVYSRGKAETERALLELHRQRGLPLVIARPGVVLGDGAPMQHPGLGLWVRDNHCVGWGVGDHPLPVVDVDDVAEALARIALHDGDGLDGQALNLCARAPLSAREIVEELRRATGRDLHFHPRPLWLSQALEIGKWTVKKAGRRPGARFPSYRDLKSRSLAPPFTSRTAREVLGWQPIEDREAFLDKSVRVHGDRG